jgi:hypothetical protein
MGSFDPSTNTWEFEARWIARYNLDKSSRKPFGAISRSRRRPPLVHSHGNLRVGCTTEFRSEEYLRADVRLKRLGSKSATSCQ